MNDHQRAQKLRAEGRMTESASQKAQRKEQSRSSNPSPLPGVEDPMDAMRRAVATPRDAASRGRASSHKRGLPRLG